MSTKQSRVLTFLSSLVESNAIDALRTRLRPRFDAPLRRILGGAAASLEAIEKRLTLLNASPDTRNALTGLGDARFFRALPGQRRALDRQRATATLAVQEKELGEIA